MSASTEVAGGLEPYVPNLLAGWVGEIPGHRVVGGTLLYADVSGFTRLSERLAQRGRSGAEEITATISDVWQSLLSVSGAGDALKFAGDALIIFFDGPDHAGRACAAALAMQEALAACASIRVGRGSVRLRMSIGIHTGQFHMMAVGDGHVDLLILGEAATRTVLTEEAANAGEVLVGHETATRLGDRLEARGERETGVLIRDVAGVSEVAPHESSHARRPDLFVSPLLRDRLGAGIAFEHRRVTIGFCQVGGVDRMLEEHGEGAVFDEMQQFVTHLMDVLETHGVLLSSCDLSQDGVVFMITGGAPDAGDGDHASRMMHLAMQLLADSGQLDVRMGINSGHVFVGPVGPPSRRAYVAMGDTVNLAARVMAKAAWGEVLVTASSIDAANDRFVLRDVPAFQVKGKRRPVEAMAIESLAPTLESRSGSAGPFVGRDGELALLRDSLESALSGRGRVVEILGEQGVGKSRLVAEFRSSTGDARWVTAACDPFDRTTPYQTARLLVRRVLGIERDATAIEAGTLLESIVKEHAPRLLPWLPLIAVIVDAEVAATEESSDVDPRFRRVKTQQVVADLMEAIGRVPAVMSIEDAEHMDDASAELISELLGRMDDRPWLVVITRAPGNQGLHHGRGYQATVVDLHPLDQARAADLARRLAEKSPVSPHLLPEIVERSAGNPLFLSEMLAHAGSEIPHSVEDIVAVRIDALAPPDRSALRHLAVLGEHFDLGLVESVLGDRGVAPDDEDLWRRLSGFVDVVGREVVFANPLVRQVAYDGLPFRTRRELHGRVADALGPGRRDQLPLHLVEAERWQEAWQAARRAADRARDAAANAVAGELYELALRAANSVDDIDDHEVSQVAEDAARVWAQAGVPDRALDALRVAVARATDPIQQLELEALRASVHEDAGRYPQALRLFATSLARLDDIDAPDPGRARARAALHAGYASTRLLQGRFDEAQHHAEAAVSSAEEAGDRPLQARGLHLLDRIHAAAGDFERAQYYRDAALPIFAELGDLAAQGTVLHDLAADAHRSGRLAEAVWLYQRAADSRSRAGDVGRAAATINSLGQVEQALGMLDSAEQRFTEALRTWRGARSPQGVVEATINLGELRVAQGRVQEARELLEEAERLALDLGLDDILARGQVSLAEAYQAVGRHVEAWERATDALQRTTVSALLRRARSVRADALEATGSIERAVDERELAVSLGGPPPPVATGE